jgi:hypothetical protein
MFEWRRTVRVALLGAALALTLGGAARAQEGGTAEEEKWSWPKWWDYSGCISTIAMAETPSGVSAAIGLCGRMLGNYWKEVT